MHDYTTYEVYTILPSGIHVWLASFVHSYMADDFCDYLKQKSLFHREGHDKLIVVTTNNSYDNLGDLIKTKVTRVNKY